MSKSLYACAKQLKTIISTLFYCLKRTARIKWRAVVCHFAEIIGVTIYSYFLFDRFCGPVFREVKVKELDFKAYLNLISISIMPGAMIQFMSKISFFDLISFNENLK